MRLSELYSVSLGGGDTRFVVLNLLARVECERHWQKGLAGMIEQPGYRDSYLSSDPVRGDFHGPYVASELSSASYTRIDLAEGRETVRSLLSPFESSHQALVQECCTAIHARLGTCDAVYKLAPEAGVGMHAAGWVLSQFDEFVLFSADSDEAVVVIFGAD